YTLMEVCGTHTMNIYRYGIRRLLPENIRLIAGPGCPVCVTPACTVAQALAIAGLPATILVSFGDMLRVPADGKNLLQARAEGADVRMALSPLDALAIAEEHPRQEVVFLAVGFETTAPLTAATGQMALERKLNNFSLLAAHKTMPRALKALFSSSSLVDGLLCPGHVAAITGADYFKFVPDILGKPAAVAGFEPEEILLAIRALLLQLEWGQPRLDNCYRRAVSEAGNSRAMAVMKQVYQPCDALWRGLGELPGSGLEIRPEYQNLDAQKRFTLEVEAIADNPDCCCGQILQGRMQPEDCPLFAKVCTPEHPEGACMVSAEGGCAAAYRYGEQVD
ncbi:MAG: hydrogenase formation protein HypD, partial [Clostridiales bacterium]